MLNFYTKVFDMRYTPAPMFLDFTGKSGGYVFSRNKGGNYLKGFVPPSNPDTTAQVNAREDFAQVAPLWIGLTPTLRSEFDAFANTNYQPLKRPNVQTSYTGRQAFSALAIAAKYGIRFLGTLTAPSSKLYIGSGLSTPTTVTNYAVPTTVPGLYLSSNLIAFGSWSSGFTDFTYIKESAINHRLMLTVTTPVPAATYTTQVPTIGGSPFGLALYISNEVPADQIKTQNDFESKLIQTQVLNACTITVAAPQTEIGINIQCTSPNLPTTTGWRKATVVACTSFGGQRVLMSKYINFSA